ncbi:MAG: AMP-binding protein, partial [Bacteroidota bacterium]
MRTHYDRSTTVQHIAPTIQLEVPLIDLAELSEQARSKELNTLREAEITIPFDLFKGPLFRAKIIRMSDREHHLLMSVHHGIADGWSFGVLARDLAALYTGIVHKRVADLPNYLQLSDYALQQEAYRQSEESEAAAAYWVSQFEDGVPVLEFPSDRSRPASKTYDAALEKIIIDQATLDQLQQFSAKEGTTLFITLYAAFQVLIQRLSGQEDFVLGLVAAGQAGSGFENTVMHGVSLLPLRMQVAPHQSFSQHLKASRNKVLDAFEHQHYTLGSLVKQLKLARDPSRQPIISILFNMDSPMGNLTFGDLEVDLAAIPRHYETFDLFINIKPIPEGAAIEWTYNTDLFDQTTIQRRLQTYEILLHSILKDATEKVGKLPILSPTERHQLLVDWNDTTKDFPRTASIHSLFEAQCQKSPDALAVAANDRQLSYRELNEAANQLAHLLYQKGVRTGDFVGIFVERSVELLVSLMATLKVGGIYVPLDPANPKERLRVIMEDAEARWLITQERLMSQLPEGEQEVLCLERLASTLAQKPKDHSPIKVSSEAIAYVIYTSGSTGRPKGILIPHYAVVDHHLAMIDAVGISAQDRMLSVASVSFDPSVQDFFLPLFIGGSVVIATHAEVVDGFLLKTRMEKSAINFMQATPSTWRMLLMAGWQGHPDLLVMSIGEALNKELANQLLARGRSLWNAYGPSETTIYTTVRQLQGDRMATSAQTSYEPVGRPLNNAQVYILDPFMEPVPIGVGGELYVGGVGVAPG